MTISSSNITASGIATQNNSIDTSMPDTALNTSVLLLLLDGNQTFSGSSTWQKIKVKYNSASDVGTSLVWNATTDLVTIAKSGYYQLSCAATVFGGKTSTSVSGVSGYVGWVLASSIGVDGSSKGLTKFYYQSKAYESMYSSGVHFLEKGTEICVGKHASNTGYTLRVNAPSAFTIRRVL